MPLIMAFSVDMEVHTRNPALERHSVDVHAIASRTFLMNQGVE